MVAMRVSVDFQAATTGPPRRVLSAATGTATRVISVPTSTTNGASLPTGETCNATARGTDVMLSV
jgi:hypothetical protein